MSTLRKSSIALGIVVLVTVWVVFTRGPAAPSANPPGTFSFAVLGDAPYYTWEAMQFRVVMQDMAAHDLSWVLHVGDIFWRPCSEEMYRRHLGWFNELPHPVIYTPGDNEWADCWEPGSGAYTPLGRLDRIRAMFFEDPTGSLGGRNLPLVSQGGQPPFPELVENARWTAQGIVFATVHLVGSRNARDPFPGRTAADDRESRQRTDAAATWIGEAFAEAAELDAVAVVLFMHANPDFELPADSPYRRAYDPFLAVLEDETERFGRPVLVAHGDHHDLLVDHPLARRATGHTLDNLTRLQVPGSPLVGWVRVVVTPGADEPFAFEPRVIPRWKYW